MRPTPIPETDVWAGGRRLVIGPPDGDLTNPAIASVEAIVDQDELGISFSMRMVLDYEDVARITAGQRVFWYTQRGEHLHPFWIGWADEA